MLAPPTGLTEEALVASLARGWGIEVAGLEYRAVGFGSHHWEVVEAGGARWFVTVDELLKRRLDGGETPARVQERLAASLGAARVLRNAGRRFDYVVAPVPALDGQILLSLGTRMSVAVYPLVEGESFHWGRYTDPDHLQAVLAMLVATHTAPQGLASGAPLDDLRIQMRAELERSLEDESGAGVPERGPYTVAFGKLMREHHTVLRSSLRRYDELASAAGGAGGANGRGGASGAGKPPARVLTHGEPHPGNTMLALEGWKLIDWDTAALAPPERDLWSLDPGDDGTAVRTYADATGHEPSADLMRLYRLRWDLTDLALYATDFRAEHADDANAAQGWQSAREVVQGLADAAARTGGSR